MTKLYLGELVLLTANKEDADRLEAMTCYWSKSQQAQFLDMCRIFTKCMEEKAGRSLPARQLFVHKNIIDWLAKQPIKTAARHQQKGGYFNSSLHQQDMLMQQQQQMHMQMQQQHIINQMHHGM